jgi:hypothetical protein
VALTNAQKQANYRARHLGPDGERHRLVVDISGVTIFQLKRLRRWRKEHGEPGITITRIVEELAAAADSEARHGMTESERRRYTRRMEN